jgi:membrane associated rhomboid family serine protease
MRYREPAQRDAGATTTALPPFPTGPVLAVAALVLFHFALVIWRIESYPGGESLLRKGGLLAGGTAEEPWRLLTSLFLHVDMRHVFWNGVSTLVFAVPLLTYLGFPRSALIYLGAGVGGGIAALAAAPPGPLIVGSSGAVAGLFGAWVVLRFRSARYAEISWRARVRAAGVGLLVLPTLLNPTTPAGQPVSVSSHLGGLVTGMLVGALISGSLLPREPRLFDDEAELPEEWTDQDPDDRFTS